MTSAPKKSTPSANHDPIPPAEITPADPDASLSASAPPASMDPDVVQSAPSPLDASKLAVEDKTSITMADVAALNGIGLAPDESGRVDRGEWTLAEAQENGVFISAGMASDLEQQGFTLDPSNGRKIVRERIEEKKDK